MVRQILTNTLVGGAGKECCWQNIEVAVSALYTLGEGADDAAVKPMSNVEKSKADKAEPATSQILRSGRWRLRSSGVGVRAWDVPPTIVSSLRYLWKFVFVITRCWNAATKP